jgi:uncharacterized protein YbjT (DUF2867 family)
VELNYDKPETVDKALEGVDKVFFLNSFGVQMLDEGKKLFSHISKHKGFAILRLNLIILGIKHIVKLSGYKADTPGYILGKMHVELENLIKQSGIPFTFLRPNSFCQNIGAFFGQSIKGGNNIYSAFWDQSKIAYIDTRDIGAVAAEVLTRDEFIGKTIDLNGPESLTHHQVAEIISKVIGRKISYVDVTDEQYRSSMKGYGFPDPLIDILLNLYSEYKEGNKEYIR